MKHLRYFGYVLRHRWYVLVECVRLGVLWRGLTHDLSKFLPSEWAPYANYFYGKRKWGKREQHDFSVPIDRTSDVEAASDLAWLKHIHRNKHHWQYWRLREDDGGTKLIPMPTKYVKEMLADWRGAEKVQGFTELGPWYEKNYSKIEMADETRDLLHSMMSLKELPKEHKVTVITKSNVTGVSFGSDGKLGLEGRIVESHEERRR